MKDKRLLNLCTFVEQSIGTGRADFGILRAPVERRDRLLEERILRDRYQIAYFEQEDKRRSLGILRPVNQRRRFTGVRRPIVTMDVRARSMA